MEPWPELDRFLAQGGRERLLSVARRYCGNLAEDAVQEALISAYRTRHNYRSSRGDVSAWVIVITQRTAMNIRDRSAYRGLGVSAEIDADRREEDGDQSIADEVVEQWDIQRLRGLFEALLPYEDALILTEIFASDCTPDQARETVRQKHGLSDEALRQRIHRARERFIEVLSQAGYESQIQGCPRLPIEEWEQIIASARSRMPAHRVASHALSNVRGMVKVQVRRRTRRADALERLIRDSGEGR